jgi:hypothetical protein
LPQLDKKLLIVTTEGNDKFTFSNSFKSLKNVSGKLIQLFFPIIDVYLGFADFISLLFNTISSSLFSVY